MDVAMLGRGAAERFGDVLLEYRPASAERSVAFIPFEQQADRHGRHGISMPRPQLDQRCYSTEVGLAASVTPRWLCPWRLTTVS